ncbi:receptor-like serine/threonine-protein kinase SD1-8 isoform X1 [Rosa chinensis]|uniref:receptor-like serine/threonine-protein kinase SD1-8 isoform X1 n=2 Tax=Rosa chinensis TaxID=74649 RepID=UPI000D08D709|nr:receptor-like serine/threonine-protein kinase SD1-8 isoform X1 [Rosa chinensis]
MPSTRVIIRKELCPLICFIFLFSFFLSSSFATDTLTPGDTLTVNQTLVSAGGVFELGFFKSDFSGSYYLGIWFRADANKVVWVGNRRVPILDASGSLQILSGNLVLIDRRQNPLLVSTGNVAMAINATATLLDSGNFILKEENTGTMLWQSFDIPTDTYLPGMKLGWSQLNSNQPIFRAFVSWVNPQNPALGNFTLTMNRINFTKLQVWRGNIQMNVGSWDGHNVRFIFNNSTSGNDYNFSYHSNADEVYFTFSGNKNYDLMWFVMASTGKLDQYYMVDGKISSVSNAVCDPTGSCLNSLPSMCKNGDSFSQVKGSLPSTFNSGSINMGTADCESWCRSNCSCTSFASPQNDQVCQLYYGRTHDLLKIIEKGTGIIYIRGGAPSDVKNWKLWLATVLPLASLLVLIPTSLCCYLRWRRRRKAEDPVTRREGIINLDLVSLFQMGTNESQLRHDEVRGTNNLELGRQKDQELPLFSFATIQTATHNFAEANKLGEGGFGPVYKGKLPVEGPVIAVKRLSKISRQGLGEFKNEVSVICKLQHRNLVRLFGCCIEAEESILVYEYMPNKSLDFFIFDSTKRVLLDWRKRINIIEGIAQGLQYLHKYSRLRIIHRDLKPSNILLDSDMNPKISDFGMARIFGDNDSKGKTNRVVGTFGYMSPEYAMDGLFSEKSDVFSFGVILLEIISAKKNIAFFEADHSLNLLGKAWNLWKEGSSMELMDPTLGGSCSSSEAIRCTQIGLLCVQERATDRPTMSDVISMLSNQSCSLPLPKQPAFLSQLSSTDADSSSSRHRHYSQNDMTISEEHGR